MYSLVPEKILRLVYEPFYLAIYSCTAQRVYSPQQAAGNASESKNY